MHHRTGREREDPVGLTVHPAIVAEERLHLGLDPGVLDGRLHRDALELHHLWRAGRPGGATANLLGRGEPGEQQHKDRYATPGGFLLVRAVPGIRVKTGEQRPLSDMVPADEEAGCSRGGLDLGECPPLEEARKPDGGPLPLDQVAAAAICLGALLLLSLELMPMDQVGLLALAAVILTGLMEPAEALAGFGHPGVITIGALLVVAEGLYRTGALAWVGRELARRAKGKPGRLLVYLCISVAAASAFVNNTPIVAVFLPMVLGLCQRFRVAPSRLLIPLSYASILGGTCTVLGTSTNLIVSEILAQDGHPPIGIFEVLPVGGTLTVVGLAYLLLVGRRLLPDRPSLGFNPDGPAPGEFVTEVALRPGSPLVGRPLRELIERLTARPLALIRREEIRWNPPEEQVLQPSDLLLVKGPVESIAAVHRLSDLELLPELKEDGVSFDPRRMRFVELLVPTGSAALGCEVKDLGLHRQAGLVVVAVMRRGRHIREKVTSLTLQAGDVLLAFGDERSIGEASGLEEFVLTEGAQEKLWNRHKAPLAVLFMATMVATMVTGFLSVPVAAMSSALAMVLAGCLRVRQAYRALNWRILFLLVGALAMGKALETSGLAARFAGGMVDLLGGHPMATLLALYLCASLLTELLSNGAVAVLMTPIALSLASALSLDPRTFIMTVLFACSASFLTPVGYQTNTLVYGVGGYRYRDFLVVGLPLQALCFLVNLILVPLVWPFKPV